MNTESILKILESISRDVKEINEVFQHELKKSKRNLNDVWIDGQDVMQTLHISKRTLQTLRDSEMLPYSRINGKFYYKVSDIEKMLEAHYQIPKSAGHGSN